MDLKLVKLASVREHMDAHYRDEISYQKAIDLINEDANKQLRLYGVSSSKRFCTTDLLNAYQAGAVEMYNKIVNSIEKQTLKGLREDSQEWLKLYDN